MSTTIHPEQRAELNELKRQVAQRILDNARAGRVIERRTLRWAGLFVRAHKPLGRPLGTGER